MSSPSSRSRECPCIRSVYINCPCILFVDLHTSIFVYVAPDVHTRLDCLCALKEHLASDGLPISSYTIEDTKGRTVGHEYVGVVWYTAI